MTKQRSEAYGSSFRQNRFQLFKTMIEDIIAQQGHCKILDVGGEFDYWKPFLPLLEGLPIEVVITNIDDRSAGFADPRFSSKFANACDLFPEGKLISERVCGLTKSLIITRAAA